MRYPVSLDLRGLNCVVVGGGAVATHKVAGLLQAGAVVTVISPWLAEPLQQRADDGSLHWLAERRQPGRLATLHPALVFAATDDRDTNAAIAAEARALGVPVNVVDDAAVGSFINMAVLRRPPLTIALDSGGSAPALVRWLKGLLATCVREEHATLARWLGELRPGLQAEIPEAERRRKFYSSVLDSDVLALLAADQVDEARKLLHSLVKQGR